MSIANGRQLPPAGEEVVVAALNNARWCDAVCRSHGLEGRFDIALWTSTARMPLLYPDAVTLRRSVDPEVLLGRIDPAPGGAVKDSFADVDLAPHAFRILFEATWILRPSRASVGTSEPKTALDWTPVDDRAGLRAWTEAWQRNGGHDGVFRAGLLADAAVMVLAGRLGRDVVAGAVVTLSDDVVGLSNVFADREARHGLWRGCLAWVDRTLPERRVVGYESGRDLQVAAQHGFAPVGPLRVWLRTGT